MKPSGALTPVVVKVGGSLFDLPDLGPRLRRFLKELAVREVVLVPGGGATADVVRELDRCHRLGDDAAHWLALRGLSLNAWFLATLLSSSCRVIGGWEECRGAWAAGAVPIIDAHRFVEADEARAGALPHAWDVTSDSLAARLAVAGGARRLLLLKSVTIPPGMDWAEAGRRGLVDRYFAHVLEQTPTLHVGSTNLRTG